MNSTLLNVGAIGDGPVFHGEPADTAYLDDDPDFVDDVSVDPADLIDEPEWYVDTGAGEFTATVSQRDSVL